MGGRWHPPLLCGQRCNASTLQSVDKALRESLAFISIQRRNDALHTKRWPTYCCNASMIQRCVVFTVHHHWPILCIAACPMLSRRPTRDTMHPCQGDAFLRLLCIVHRARWILERIRVITRALLCFHSSNYLIRAPLARNPTSFILLGYHHPCTHDLGCMQLQFACWIIVPVR